MGSTTPANDADADTGETLTDVASCTAPNVAYGGGGLIADGSSDASLVVSSYPSDATTNRDWTYSVHVSTDVDTGAFDPTDDVTVTAFVLCGNP